MSPLMQQALRVASAMRRPEVVRLPADGPVLLFAPHPDDEVLGAGGTLRKHVEAGHDVKVVFVTDGSRGRRRGTSSEEAVARRRGEAEAAAAVLGIGSTAFLALPDSEFVPTRALCDAVRQLILDFCPVAIYVPNPAEQHRDHLVTSVLVAEALLDAPRPFEVIAYEVWTPLLPSCVVNVTAQMPAKLEALRCYASQLTLLGYEAAADALGRYRSLLLPSPESRYGEAFSRCDHRDFQRQVGLHLCSVGPTQELAPQPQERRQ